MYSLEDREFLKGVAQDIVDRLDNWEGREMSASSLPYNITESESANWSWYCNPVSAKEDILKHWDVFGGVYAYEKVELGGNKYNPFSETEYFHCCCMIDLYRLTCDMMMGLAGIDSNDEITIDSKFIKAMQATVDKVDVGETLECYDVNDLPEM